MTRRIEFMRNYFIVEKKHHAYRQCRKDKSLLAEEFSEKKLPPLQRAVERVRYILGQERPVVFPDEKIALMRTVQETPDLFTKAEFDELGKKHWIHESGDFNNFCPDYKMVLEAGFYGLKDEIKKQVLCCREEKEKLDFLKAMYEMIELLEGLAEKYRKEAIRIGNLEVAQSFSRIPEETPETMQEAVQFIRLLNYGLWSANNYQCALGRMDQILYPYYQKDIREGRLTREGALELVEEFFLSLNRDSDLYDGIQQGDNGQSLVLGGLNQDGTDSFNELSEIMLQASLELKIIDPKINIRVNRRTPLERYIQCTELTKAGLGFPQYMNDDIIIPALLDWGYTIEDAYQYVTAACWEPIIPGCGTDIVNADGLNFPESVLKAVKRQLINCKTYEKFEKAVCEEIVQDAKKICGKLKNLYVFPAPMASFMMDDCIKTAKDAADGCRYMNIGIHGVGISTAVDSLASIQKYVYETKELESEELLDALDTNFERNIYLKNKLRFDAPKMGEDNEKVDRIAAVLLESFANALRECRTEHGGVFRPGTGTAMYYIWFGKSIPATPDGRVSGEPLPANYSPSLFAHTKGPISVIKSFTRQNLQRVANGGPLTLELHDSVFRSVENIEKVAQIVRLFILRGGHQLQINAVNREDMIRAKQHPEEYKNMIVRVWGWSGYFVELDEEYQDQIIQRTEYAL